MNPKYMTIAAFHQFLIIALYRQQSAIIPCYVWDVNPGITSGVMILFKSHVVTAFAQKVGTSPVSKDHLYMAYT